MRPEEVPAELVEVAQREYLPGLYDTGEEAMRAALAAVLPAHREAVLSAAILNGAALPAERAHPNRSEAQRRAIDVILDHLDPPDRRLGQTGWCMNVEKIVRALAAHGLLRFEEPRAARLRGEGGEGAN